MKTAIAEPVDVSLRDDWLQVVAALSSQIKEWVRQEPEWSFEPEETLEREEPLLGLYTVTPWSIHTPKGEVRLEPMPQDFLGRRFVELYAWPTLRRVYLLPAPEKLGWKILTDSGIFLRQDWNRENCLLLIQDLINAE